jgi:hypothetical protein
MENNCKDNCNKNRKSSNKIVARIGATVVLLVTTGVIGWHFGGEDIYNKAREANKQADFNPPAASDIMTIPAETTITEPVVTDITESTTTEATGSIATESTVTSTEPVEVIPEKDPFENIPKLNIADYNDTSDKLGELKIDFESLDYTKPIEYREASRAGESFWNIMNFGGDPLGQKGCVDLYVHSNNDGEIAEFSNLTGYNPNTNDYDNEKNLRKFMNGNVVISNKTGTYTYEPMEILSAKYNNEIGARNIILSYKDTERAYVDENDNITVDYPTVDYPNKSIEEVLQESNPNQSMIVLQTCYRPNEEPYTGTKVATYEHENSVYITVVLVLKSYTNNQTGETITVEADDYVYQNSSIAQNTDGSWNQVSNAYQKSSEAWSD